MAYILLTITILLIVVGIVFFKKKIVVSFISFLFAGISIIVGILQILNTPTSTETQTSEVTQTNASGTNFVNYGDNNTFNFSTMNNEADPLEDEEENESTDKQENNLPEQRDDFPEEEPILADKTVIHRYEDDDGNEINSLAGMKNLISEKTAKTIVRHDVFTGPDDTYYHRSGALAVSNTEVTIYGIENDWVFIQYEAKTKSSWKYGWVPRSVFREKDLKGVSELVWHKNSLKLMEDTFVLDGIDFNFYAQETHVGELTEGTDIIGLAVVDGTWVYCEFQLPNTLQWCRGFVSSNVLFTSDEIGPAKIDDSDNTEEVQTDEVLSQNESDESMAGLPALLYQGIGKVSRNKFVYSGPGESYWRRTMEFISRDADVWIYGAESGWVIIGYYNEDIQDERYGWVPAGAINTEIVIDENVFSRRKLITQRSCKATDNPGIRGERADYFASFEKGTVVTALGAYGTDWIYCEFSMPDGTLARGFISYMGFL